MNRYDQTVSERAAKLWAAIQETNRRWMAGRASEVADFFHENVVMASPDGKVMVRGRHAMVESFEAYCARATTHAFSERSHEVVLFGNTAIVSYTFDVKYEIDGTVLDEVGHEMLVLRDDGGWQVVWRMQLATPPSA